MSTIAQELEATIRSCQIEIDKTYEHFNLMLSLRKEIVAEYELIRSKYKSLNNHLDSDIKKLRDTKREMRNHVSKSCTWSGPYPLSRPLSQK